MSSSSSCLVESLSVRAAGVGAEDAAVVVRVLLLLRVLVVVIRACEDDDEIAIGLSSQLLAADSGRRLHRILALGRCDCSTDEVGGRAVGLDNLTHSSIVPLLGHKDVVSMRARSRVRGEEHTVRAPRERAAPAVMSIPPSCTVAPITAPAPVSGSITPTIVHTSAELRRFVGPPGAAAMK